MSRAAKLKLKLAELSDDYLKYKKVVYSVVTRKQRDEIIEKLRSADGNES